MELLFEVEFTCALCGHTFEDPQVAGPAGPTMQDSEFRTDSLGSQLWIHLIHTCPSCGFTDYDHDVEFTDEERQRIGGFLGDYLGGRAPAQLAGSKRYEILGRGLEFRKKASDAIANAYLRAAWLADDEEQPECSRMFRMKALDFFIKGLVREEVPAQDVARCAYLIGELNRRLGRFDEALQWFKKVQTRSPIMKSLCRQQAILALQRSDEPAMIPPPLPPKVEA